MSEILIKNVEDFLSSDTLQKIVKIVCDACKKKGEIISESLAMYTIKILNLNPKFHGFHLSSELNAIVDQLTQEAVEILTQKDHISTLLIKLQVYYDLNFRSREKFITEYEKETEKKTKYLLKKILALESHLPNEFIFDEIVKFILAQEEEQICDSQHDVFKEMKNVVLRVFAMSKIPDFLTFSRRQKIDCLADLSSVTTGIKLYACWTSPIESASKPINRVLSILKEVTPKLTFKLRTECLKLQEIAKDIQDFYVEYLTINIMDLPPNLLKNTEDLKSSLSFIFQYCSFIIMMMEECHAAATRSFALEYIFKTAIHNLKTVLSTETTLPTSTFSYYKDLANIWKLMKEELLFIKSIINIYNELENLIQVVKTRILNNKYLEKWNKDEADTKRKLKAGEEEFNDIEGPFRHIVDPYYISEKINLLIKKHDITLVFPETVKNFYQLSLEFNEFCPWAISEEPGLLCKGNREHGIVVYKNKCYAFSSVKARNEFICSPDDILDRMQIILQNHGYLTLILNIHQKFGINMYLDPLLKEYYIPPIFTSSSECQTELHPVETNLDYSYRWNLWHLRAQAIKYVNIKTKQTRSTQTTEELSHFRRENFSQVYLPKDNWSQTKRDGSTITPRQWIFDYNGYM